MSVRCGNHRGLAIYHETAADVRACYQSPNIEDVEREMHAMEAEAERAEAERDAAAKVAKWDAESDRNPAAPSAIRELRELLETKETPEGERRYASAVKEMLDNGLPTGYAVRVATARISAWRNVRAGGYGHKPDAGQWSSADRERAQVARSRETGPSHEGLYKLSRAVTLFDGTRIASGTLVQVMRGKESQKMYAKTVAFNGATTSKGHPKPDLTYVKGLIFKILDSELVPVDEAEELTRKTGWCIFGHFLTNPVSIARGMGPECYARYPHLARTA